MFGTVLIKGLCWIWCRLVKNSSVQALAEDAMTDVIFNMGSIFFPIVGFYAKIWWLDALGGLILSLVVIVNWSRTSLQHIKNLSGFSATADQRNICKFQRRSNCIFQIHSTNINKQCSTLQCVLLVRLSRSRVYRPTTPETS